MNPSSFFQYFRVDLKEVQHLIGRTGGPFFVEDVLVKTNTWSLRVFKRKGFQCAECGLNATFCWVQKQKRDEVLPHLALYAEKDGQDVPLTVDHIIAMADGGTNALHNLQTLCWPCNERKASNAVRMKLPCCGGNFGTVKGKGLRHTKDCTHGTFLRVRWYETSRWTLG